MAWSSCKGWLFVPCGIIERIEYETNGAHRRTDITAVVFRVRESPGLSRALLDSLACLFRSRLSFTLRSGHSKHCPGHLRSVAAARHHAVRFWFPQAVSILVALRYTARAS